MEFSGIIARLKQYGADPCISITTAKASGDATRLHRHLEDALGEAMLLMRPHYGDDRAEAVLQRARQELDTLGAPDERPGLALFASAAHAELVRLPFAVPERVTVGSSFFTRDLLRSGLDTIHHHVLVLSWDRARLLEAQDAFLIGEHGGAFPLRMDATGADQAAEGEDPDQRFHRRVDEAVRRAIGKDATVVLHAPADIQRRYIAVVRYPGIYVGKLEPGEVDVSDAELVGFAWQVAYVDRKRRDLSDFARMAQSAPRITAAPDAIWTVVQDGNPGVLFVERDLH
ncbi:MAG: hypothetical protein QY325_03870 [Flavobacteriales bacterium]|nr:MAG: hypothetical protein QY325_03870 [Flavobacteriales bacterium]